MPPDRECRENESIGNESNSLVNGVVDTFLQVAAVTNDVLMAMFQPMSSIVVNGKEYSPSNRGLLFVVYDLNEGCVIDAASFDTARDSFTGEQSKGTLDTRYLRSWVLRDFQCQCLILRALLTSTIQELRIYIWGRLDD